MTLHDSYVKLAKDVQILIEVSAADLGLQDVFYGDQVRIPRTPAVCIEPGGKTRTLNGLPRRTEVSLTAYILIYHYKLNTPEVIREANDTLAEDIEAVLHLDAQLKESGEPTVIDSMVTSVESGFQPKNNSLFRASRLTFEAHSQVLLPSQFSTP